ncbi:Nicotinamide/nicotinic acid mononucleotide adenylyltransferase [Lachnellula suecica]|uniref:Nicotinamide-nucleotide adenylyltransferase n=1 Tax=Lachnellula suecica TaxID=602035 RepID=A0A8T9CET8_9HELO|nr:Nicotinamide/nicotinic acid mononucleotide adenylyltransferase [Lachnellula suecica]
MASDVPAQVPAQPAAPQTLQPYSFPHQRLSLLQRFPEKTPLVLVACGSFSPITYLHLRMFEMASDYARFNTNFEVMGGFISPVGDGYVKKGLAPAADRLNMCRLALESASWLIVDPWEGINPKYTPTAKVLDHFEHEINEVLGGVQRPDGSRVPARICLLAGADLIQTMSTPGVWSPKDLDHILGRFGLMVIERSGTDVEDAISNLHTYRDNIWVIPQLVQNDVSSTKIRLFLKRDMSVRYLIPGRVIEYIESHDLYNEEAPSVDGKGKANGETSGRASPAPKSSPAKS